MRLPNPTTLSTRTKLSLATVGLLGLVMLLTVSVSMQRQGQRSQASLTNVVSNPGFESGTSSWYMWNRGSGKSTFTTTTSTKSEGNTSAQISISSPGSVETDIELAQYGKQVTTGQTYTVSVALKASMNRNVEVVVQDSASPYHVFMRKTAALTTNWQTFTYTFQSPETKSDALVGVWFAKAGGTVWVDDVKMFNGVAPTATPVPTVAPTSTPKPPTATPAPAATNTPVPSATPTIKPSVTPSVTPTPTPKPTGIVLISATPFPTAVPSSTPVVATNTPAPSSTPVPGSTMANLTVLLHGIGKGGDSVNANSTGNLNPLHPQRTVTVDIYDVQNQLVATKQGLISYNAAAGNFTGSVDLGTQFVSGIYTVKVKTDKYLRSIVSGIQTITKGQTTTIPSVTLVNGDVNNDNQINIVDYNIIVGCYSDLLPAVDCNPTKKDQSDLNDDGNVNQFDYNLFVRELTNIGGQ